MTRAADGSGGALRWFRRVCLRIALGNRKFAYMARSLTRDPRTVRAKETDIVVRKDGVERRIEADWLRDLARLVGPEDGGVL